MLQYVCMDIIKYDNDIPRKNIISQLIKILINSSKKLQNQFCNEIDAR